MAQDEAGFVLVFYAVCIPVLLGLIGLVIDGGRLMSLDAQSAAFSDAAALAAAAHLDRSPGAIPAARAAALALRNRPRFAETGGDRLAFRFAARLSDFSNATYSLPDGAGAEAAYVEVTTAEASLTGSFLTLVGARPGPVRRRAVAESQYYACDVTPAVLCHPDPAAFAATARPGRQYRLTMDGNKVAGSIALLDKPGAMDGHQSLRDLAGDQPAFCYAEGVRLRTTIAPVEFDDAVNVRFDRYQGRAGPVAPDLAVYPPAPNIIDGRAYQSCVAPLNFYDTTPPFALPRDSGYQGLVPTGPWDKGTGDWRFAQRSLASALERPSTSTCSGTTRTRGPRSNRGSVTARPGGTSISRSWDWTPRARRCRSTRAATRPRRRCRRADPSLARSGTGPPRSATPAPVRRRRPDDGSSISRCRLRCVSPGGDGIDLIP